MGKFIELFGKKPRVVVLEAFAENPDMDLSVPDISVMSGVAKGSLYTHVRYLIEEGILAKTRKEGRTQYYGFNGADPRGYAITYLESTLAFGALGHSLKRDVGLSSTQSLPEEYYYSEPHWRGPQHRPCPPKQLYERKLPSAMDLEPGYLFDSEVSVSNGLPTSLSS